MYKDNYFNPQQISREMTEPDLEKWFVAYEDMWKLIREGYTQADVVSHLTKKWDDGEVGRFLQWVRFYEADDDKKYAFDVNSSFIKVAVSMPGISLRNISLTETINKYKQKMFSRLKSLRTLIEEGVFKLPEDLVMDHAQAQKAMQLIHELSTIVRNLNISRATTASSVVSQVKTIEDLLCRIGMVISTKKNPLFKLATSNSKKEILHLLQSAHKSFVEKSSVRELALAFSKDSLGQFPDIGQALAKMIEAHNYVTPRIEEIMSNISVQIGTEQQITEEPQQSKDIERAPKAEEESQEIEVKMPEGTGNTPRIFNR